MTEASETLIVEKNEQTVQVEQPKTKQGVVCILCEQNNVKYIAKGWTGLSTHVAKGHSPIKYDKLDRVAFGYETTERSTTPNTTWGKVRTENAAKKRKSKTLGLMPKGRIIDSKSPVIRGDKIILPLLVEFDISIDVSNAKVIQPSE